MDDITENTIIRERTEQDPLVNLTEMTNEGTQKRTIADLFERNRNIWISKRFIETNFTLTTSLNHVDFMNIVNSVTHSTITGTNEEFNESFLSRLIETCAHVPGDVQRQLRTFHNDFCRYGLRKRGTGSNIEYCWVPIRRSEMETIIHPAMRNIFNTVEQRNDFMTEETVREVANLN